MGKENVVYTQTAVLFSHKEEGNFTIHNNMGEPWGYYAKWSKSNRERQILYGLTYMWNLKKKIKKHFIDP